VNAEDFPVVPRCAEWTMVGFCDHIFCRATESLEKDLGGLRPTESSTPEETEDQRWLSEEPCWLHDTRENNIHWTSLAPELHSATAIADETFPTQQWTDLMPPGLVDTSDFSAHPCQYVAVTPNFPAAAPHFAARVNPAWSTAGHTPIMSLDGGVTDGAPAFMGPRRGDH
ncbi:unnamed protein product, partial [Scytosiphon promiscuus]